MRKKILFIQPTESTFMEIDFQILRSKYEVDRCKLNQTNKRDYSKNLFKLLFSCYSFREYDAFVTWFGDYHSAIIAFLGKLLKTKTVLFIGGYDAVYYPDKNIGVYNDKIRGAFCKYAITHSDLIIANHQSLIESNNLYIDNQPRYSGLKKIIPGFKTKYSVIYNGTDIFKADTYDKVKEQKLVLITGATANWEDIYNKGFDLIIEVAHRLPDYKFILVGISECWLSRLEEEYHYKELYNIKIYPLIPQKQLYDLFNKAQIYAQPSISEGMPNALIEAMLFECIPIGSNVAGIPTVIDKHGIIINSRSVVALADAIQQASIMKTGKEGSNYIKSTFSLENRANQILNELVGLIKK